MSWKAAEITEGKFEAPRILTRGSQRADQRSDVLSCNTTVKSERQVKLIRSDPTGRLALVQ